MRCISLCFLIMFFNFSSFGQVVKGKVIDAQSGKPLPYVQIGVKGKNAGMISKENGEFQFDLNKIIREESLSFSLIGYTEKSVPAYSFEEGSGTVEVKLNPKELVLREVVIEDSEIKELKKMGRETPTKTTSGHGGTLGYGWGGEWGIRINCESKQYQLQDINFHIRYNTVDSVLFRLNVYRLVHGLPKESLLNREIFVTSKKNENWISKNLLSENIVVKEDVVVTFEPIKIYSNPKSSNKLFYTWGKGYEEGHTYFRESSFAFWQTEGHQMIFPVTMYVTGRIY